MLNDEICKVNCNFDPSHSEIYFILVVILKSLNLVSSNFLILLFSPSIYFSFIYTNEMFKYPICH